MRLKTVQKNGFLLWKLRCSRRKVSFLQCPFNNPRDCKNIICWMIAYSCHKKSILKPIQEIQSVYSSNLQICKFVFDIFSLHSKITNILHFPSLQILLWWISAHCGASKTWKFKLSDIYGTIFHWIHESTLEYAMVGTKTAQKNGFLLWKLWFSRWKAGLLEEL